MTKKDYFNAFLEIKDISGAIEKYDGSKETTRNLLIELGILCALQDFISGVFEESSTAANCAFFKFLYDNGIDIWEYPELWSEDWQEEDYTSFIPNSLSECDDYAKDAVFEDNSNI